MRVSFSSIIGQPQACQAITVALASPTSCSLLLGGETGVGKSLLLASVRELAGSREVLVLPSSLSEDMLYDFTDVSEILQQGHYRQREGLLRRMHGNVVLADNLNLLPTHVLFIILDYLQQCRGEDSFCFIGAVNTEEGSISAAVLDKFDLFVALQHITEPEVRSRIIRQSLLQTDYNEHLLTANITKARSKASEIKVSVTDYRFAAQLCAEAFVSGHRADIALLHAAITHASLAGRNSLDLSDFTAVKDLALRHRINNPVPDSLPNSDHTPPHQGEQDASAPPPSEIPEAPDCNNPSPTSASAESEPDEALLAPERMDEIGRLSMTFDPINNLQRVVRLHSGFGARVKCAQDFHKGSYRSAAATSRLSYDLAIIPTIRAAAPFQYHRKLSSTASDPFLIIDPQDYRIKKRRHRTGYHILFLVDASGSMGVKKRMTEVKGMIMELLRNAYIKRDSVGMITFRGDDATLVLPFTRSVSRAHDLLAHISTGGRTPLYMGLKLACEVITSEKRKNKQLSPVLVLLTDGRATSNFDGENKVDVIAGCARRLADLTTRTIVIDTETGFIRLRKAQRIAEAMQADSYYLLDELTEYVPNIINRCL
ncbi:VWA domain-containing protein [Porphyromonas pogonae]|uniref:VWA domain-containing protein n=1 Tax=Porphyromonas pogonae TaxID=867595 RepID=UPI002E764F21|nr:VWA domain-containing protein [Porphyromonas pogonae]